MTATLRTQLSLVADPQPRSSRRAFPGSWRSRTHRGLATSLLGASLSQRATNNATAKLCRPPEGTLLPAVEKGYGNVGASHLPGPAPGLHRHQAMGVLAILRAGAQACGGYTPGPWRATAVNCGNLNSFFLSILISTFLVIMLP